MVDDSITPEELEEIKDRFRGGPRRKLIELAEDIGADYEELLSRADAYIESDGCEYWSEGDRFESVQLPAEFWDWYELVTGKICPPNIRGDFLSCSC